MLKEKSFTLFTVFAFFAASSAARVPFTAVLTNSLAGISFDETTLAMCSKPTQPSVM